MVITFITITIAATTGVPHNESGLASGLLNTSQQVGGSLGLAILSGISASAAVTYVTTHPAIARTPIGIAQAQVTGFSHALYAGVFFALTSSVISAVFIKENKNEKVNPKAAMAAV